MVVRVAVAFALVAWLEGEEVISGVEKGAAVGYGGPSVGAELGTEEDDALAGTVTAEVAAAEGQSVGRFKVDILRSGNRLSAGDNEERPFLEDPDDRVEIFGAVIILEAGDEEGKKAEQPETPADPPPQPVRHGNTPEHGTPP
jgi:hypothetical protein